MEKRPNRKDYVDEKTKVQLIADLELHIDYLEKKLLNPTPTNEGAKTAEGMNYKDQVSDETIKKIALETYFTTEGQSGFATGFLKCRSILLPILAEKDKELRSKDTELKKYDVRNGFLKEQISQLKATKSELPTDEEIGEWVCKEFKVDGLDADEDVRTQYGYLPAYFKSFAVWMRSKFPQSDGQRYGELIEWTKGIKPDFHKADNYQHGFHDCAEVLINKLQSLQSKEQEPKQDGQRYGEAITLLKELYESCNPHDVTPHKRAMGVDLGKFYVGGCGIPSNEALHKTKSFLTQEPKQDGQRYGDEDAEKLAMIEFPIPDDKKGDVYFGEKIAFLRVGFKKGYKAIQTLQSKEQEPKGSKRHNCLKNSYSDGAYIKCKICDTTINIKEPNP